MMNGWRLPNKMVGLFIKTNDVVGYSKVPEARMTLVVESFGNLMVVASDRKTAGRR